MVLREVAAARFALPVPDRATPVDLWVALIRDHRWRVPAPPSSDERDDPPRRWDADLPWEGPCWWEADWVAPPAPPVATQAKLIPIVSTAPIDDALALVQCYTHRWPCQENIIKDWLLPVGLDTNHGYAKTAIVNSEQAKQRATLEQRRERLDRWTASARQRYERACRRYDQRYAARKVHGEARYRALNAQQDQLDAQGIPDGQVRRTIREQKAVIDADLAALDERTWAALRERDAEWAKLARYCRDHRVVLRALADLAARERPMYELDDRNDQVMTVLKVALVNLGMWTRDRWFPTSYAHATWNRLVPFFELKGQVVETATAVQVVLRPFNDRQLNRDLAELCRRVEEQPPTMPDGRHLVFTVATTPRSYLSAQRRC
jgi:hypothetical protein